MAIDPQSRRRRAAAAVFLPVLGEARLATAIAAAAEWRDDNVAQIIAYVDRVARQVGIDGTTCKRLYSELHAAVRAAEGALPPDPVDAAPVIALPPVAPVAATPPMSAPAPSPVLAPAAAPTAPPSTLPPESIVFGTVMTSVIGDIVQLHGNALEDLLDACRDELVRAPVRDSLRAAAEGALASARTHAWQIEATATELADLVHMVYIALCRAIGPVEADRYLTEAIERAGRLPEARAFPPRSLL